MSTTPCAAMAEELVAYLDHELDEETRRPIASHVSTCLACRRELERLTAVRRWIRELPAVQPSPAFAAGLWDRIAAEAAPGPGVVRPLRPWRWAAPALAAAAVVAIAFQSLLRPTAPPTASKAPEQVAAPAPVARQPDAPAIAAARPAPTEEPAQVAAATMRPEDLRPEDLPPELLDHPELFLRLPVVRRLGTLEHFDAARDSHADEDGAG